MKNKLVIWGTNAENEKFLIALELQADASKVLLHMFPEAIADEAFVQKMMHEWRESKDEVSIPEGGQTTVHELSVTDSLLPDDIKVDRPDLIQRAQTEWHFAVLSAKLLAAYQQELAEFKEKVESMGSYDNKIFTSLRSFWDKVQNQSRERNLYRQHADELRDGINELFEQLKEIRKRVNSEFNAVSQNVYDGFAKALDEVEERIATGGAKFNSVFDELKKMQREYHNTRMSNEHRNKLWERLDAAFKKAKERRFGPEVNAGTIADRHDKRLSSLEDAIKRLEESLYRDDEELAFQRKKVNTSEGQLEAQIRGAKIKMIEERANGKRERLAELTKAHADVQRQAETAHEKEARIAAREAERKQIEAKKAAIKSEIEAETHAKATAATTAIPTPEKEDSLFEAASNLLGDVLLDALDTAKAVASVAVEKAEEAFELVVEKAEDALESFKKEEKEEESASAEAVADEPASAEATADEPASAEAVADEPASAEAVADEPASAEAVADEPASAEAVADEPASAEAMVDEPASAEATADEPASAEATADEPASAEATADEPASAEAMADEPASAEATADEPASAEAMADEPASAEATAGEESIKLADASQDTIIIDDVVHKSTEDLAALESINVADASDDSIIIDDVVHKSTEEAAEEKPKRAAKKKTDDVA